ncbi:MAG: hypothetical protein OEW29_17090 [Acidimicrobiia bacterium]|nr:hypothetical protein [Acidimicrobiia bacterium]MDH4365093.1 hypothetical protein [Acidimicrobiia bacterium]
MAAITATLVTSGCGSDQAATPVPTAEQLASTLITADLYDGVWTVNVPPDAPDAAASGVVPDELQNMLPKLEMCDAASPESHTAADDLAWKAFRQLDLTVDDPIQAPDMTGHMIFVQEYLTSAEPAEIETTFNLLRDGMQACLGDIPASEEGPGTAQEMTIPNVGDDRFGVLLLIEEAGGGAQWRLHETLVRQGPDLMLLNVVEITAGEGIEPRYSTDDINTFITTAVDKL